MKKKKLEGTFSKLLDVSLAKKYGWKYKTSLDEGLSNTINDFLKKYFKKLIKNHLLIDKFYFYLYKNYAW